MDNSDTFLTVQEARVLLRLSRTAMYDALRRNELPHLRIGRTIRIRRADIDQLIRVKPKPQPKEKYWWQA